jgi:chromosome segregation ATPase
MGQNASNGAGDPVAGRLEELRRQQQDSERKAKLENDRAQQYKAELADLTKAKGDLDKAYDAYRGQLGDLEDRRKDLWRYRDQRYEAARRAIGEQQAQKLDSSFSDYNDATAAQEQDLAKLRDELWQSQSDLDNADRELASAQAAFAALSGRPAAIAGSFAALEALKGRLDAADDEARHALKYVLILEFDLVLRNAGRDPGEPCRYWSPGSSDDRPAFYPAATYRDRLVAAWAAVNDKQEARRQAGETEADLRERADRGATELADRRKNRVDRIAPAAGAEDGDGTSSDGAAAASREAMALR